MAAAGGAPGVSVHADVSYPPADCLPQSENVSRVDQFNNVQSLEKTCADCHRAFVFTIGEQHFYRTRGLSDPKRCARCRKARRECLVAAGDLRRSDEAAGALLAAMPKNVGAKGSKVTGTTQVPVRDSTSTLADLGLSKKTSAIAQQLAALPAPVSPLDTCVYRM